MLVVEVIVIIIMYELVQCREEVSCSRKMQEGASTVVLTSGNKASVVPQYAAAISATLGGWVMGTILGWTSPAGPILQDSGYNGFSKIDDIQNSLVSGLMAIGAMIGAGVGGPLADKMGRRTTLIAQIIPGLVGWALMIWANSVIMMYFGRLFLGFVAGFNSVVAPMYTNEISQTHIQGTLGVLFQLNCTLGILFTYIVGSYTTVFWLSIACAVFPIINAGLMFIMPESPRYYLIKGDKSAAEESLQWLRGKNYDVKPELQETMDSVHNALAEKLSITEAFSTRAAKRGLVVGLGVMFFQQFSGINAVIFFTVQIFQDAGSSLPPYICTIIVGSIAVVMTFVSAIVVDRLGRKPLLFVSAAVMALSAFVLGIYFYIKDSGHEATAKSIGWLPLLSVSVFMIVFSIGFGPIPWMLMAEIFPPAVSGPASSIACLVNWLGVFIITMSFNPLKIAIGTHGAETLFWIFGSISVLAAIFTWTLIPETKGKTIDEVTAILGGQPVSRSDKSRTSL